MEPRVGVVNGQNIRIEQITDDSRTTTGYGFATSYAVTPNLYILASGEQAVRMPSESQVFGNQAENLVGNPNLRPEISNNYNLGFRLDSYKIKNHKFSLSATGFVRNTKDKIVALSNDRPTSNIETFPFENLNSTQAIGFEAQMNYSYKNLDIRFNTSKFSSLYKNKYSDNGQFLNTRYNVQIPNEPFFTANGNIQYSLKDVIQKKALLNLFYYCGYVASYNTIWVESEHFITPTQFIQDLGLSYVFPNKSNLKF